MSYVTKALAAASALLMGSSAIAAPLVLEGNYVKIGTNDAGTVGSGGRTDPGIQYDSTGTATFNPAYDYLTPGSPFEGWTVKGIDSDGTTVLFNYTNNNTNVGSPNITGTLVDYSGVEYRGLTFDNRAVWSGSVTEFDIEHDYRFNDNQQFVDINTRLEFKINVPTLYFGRFTDPDARAAAGDSSSTLNVRGYAGGVPETNVVLSEALASKYALGLFTAASNSNTGISAGWTTDPIDYYNGVNDGDGDYTIGMAFMFSGISAGDIVNIQYAYIFGPSSYDAAAGAVAGGAGGSSATSFSVTDVGSASAPTTPSTPTVTGTSTTDSVATSTATSTRTETTYVNRTETSTDGDGNPVVRTFVDTVVTTIPVTTTTTTTTPVTTTTYSDGSTTTSSGTPVVTTSDSDGTGTSVVTATALDATAVTRTVTTSSNSTANTTATRTVTRTEISTDADGNAVVRTYTDTIIDTTPVTTTTSTSTPVTTIVNADGTTSVVEGTATVTSSSVDGTTTSAVVATSLVSTAVTENVSEVISEVPTPGLPAVKVTLTEHKSSENDGVQKIARKHTETTTTAMTREVETTPVTTTTTADGTETVTEGATTTSYEFFNDVDISISRDALFGRVDQHEVLDKFGSAFNNTLNHFPAKSNEPVRVFSKNYLGWGEDANGYTAKSRVYGGGLEIDIKPTWTVGGQYNNINIDLDGSDSTSSLRKNHYGFFSMLRGNTLSLGTNVGFAQNQYAVDRNVEKVFENSSTTNGKEWWVNNRLYWHLNKWITPLIGYTVGGYQRDGFTESGSIQSARKVGEVSKTTHSGEVGLILSARFGGKNHDLFGVGMSGILGTNRTGELAAAFDVAQTLYIEGIHQVSDGAKNNIISAKVKFKF
jgi:hypothetical protein